MSGNDGFSDPWRGLCSPIARCAAPGIPVDSSSYKLCRNRVPPLVFQFRGTWSPPLKSSQKTTKSNVAGGHAKSGGDALREFEPLTETLEYCGYDTGGSSRRW